MPHDRVSELLASLYRALAGVAPTPEVTRAIEQCREDNGLDAGREFPEWLLGVLGAVLERHEVERALFPKIGSEVATFLAEVSQLFPGWQHDDQGEYVAMTFPLLGVRAHLSREALTPRGEHSCSYSVRRLAA